MGCSSPSPRPWARRWRTTDVCDMRPVQRQTYSYLPNCKASLPIGWYQIILLGDRGTGVLTNCPGLHSTAGWLRFKPATCWSQVKHPTATLPSHMTGQIQCGWKKQVKSLKLTHWMKDNKILTDCLKTVEFLILTDLVLLGLSGLDT